MRLAYYDLLAAIKGEARHVDSGIEFTPPRVLVWRRGLKSNPSRDNDWWLGSSCHALRSHYRAMDMRRTVRRDKTRPPRHISHIRINQHGPPYRSTPMQSPQVSCAASDSAGEAGAGKLARNSIFHASLQKVLNMDRSQQPYFSHKKYSETRPQN